MLVEGQEQETSTPEIQEASQVPAPETPAAPEVEAPAPVVDGSAEVVPAVVPAPAIAEYVPELKYKFDGQVKELDPFLKPLIKDKESNQKVIDLVQRAEALEPYKAKVADMTETVDTVKQLSTLFQEGKHERVLEALGYNDEMLMEVVRQKLERQKLPPEQKQAFEEKRRLELANEKLLADNQKYQSESQRELARVTEYEVDMELGKAEVVKFVKAFEAHRGDGEFKKLVGQRGDAMVRSLGRHVKPAEVVQQILQEWGPFLNQSPAAPVVQPKVIPHVVGGSGSPGTRAISSVADIRKRHAEVTGQDD